MRVAIWVMECPLCELGNQDPRHPALIALWLAWQHGRSPQKVKRLLVDTLRRYKLDVSVDDVRIHFGHNPSQPNPPANLARTLADDFLAGATERELGIVRMVEQVGHCTPAHLTAWHFAAAEKTAALTSCSRTVRRLRHNFVLYGRWVGGDASRTTAMVYGLGRTGSLVARGLREELDGQNVKSPPYLSSETDLNEHLLPHDLGCLDALKHLHLSGQAGLAFGERELAARLNFENLYTGRHLAFSVQRPQLTNEFGELRAAGSHTMFPDAFAVLEATERSTNRALHAPFLYEHDTGTRPTYEVADQLWQYILLARARAVNARWPELDVEGYTVPVVLATASRVGNRASGLGRGERRLPLLLSRFAELAGGRTLLGEAAFKPPIYVCLQSDIRTSGWNASAYPVWEAHGDGRRSPLGRHATLGQVLIASAAPLFRAQEFERGHDFDYEPTAFRPTKPSSSEAIAPLTGRARREHSDRLQSSERELAAQQARYETEEARRVAALSASRERLESIR